MRRWGVACVFFLVASTGATWTGYARAQTAQEATARRLFDEGKELEDKGEFGAALGKYREAEASFATAGVVFHKGFCLEMTGKLREALDAYDKAIAAAKAENKPAVEKATLARLEPLQARVPVIVVKIASKVDGLVVQLDGAPVEKGYLDGKPIRVDAGPHDVTATAPGHRSFAKQVRSQEGGSVTVDVTLDRTQSVVEPPREQGRASYAVPLATTIGTVVLAGAGVVTFLLAGSATSDAEAACPTKVSCDDERKKIRALDTVALGSFVGAAALGTVSVILWTSRRSSSSNAATTTRVVASPTTLGLSGSF